MVFDPHAPTPDYSPDRPAARYVGDSRHNLGNITARLARAAEVRTVQDFARLQGTSTRLV